jgi:hypothetical protein
MTPAGLYAALEGAIAAAETNARWWRSRHRTVAWFTTPTVAIGDREWLSHHYDEFHHPPRYGYSLYQARLMRAALLTLSEFTEAVGEPRPRR